MKHSVCTSFSQQGAAIYGETFIKSFLKHWPDDIPLMCVYEHEPPKIKDPRVTYRDLYDDTTWLTFEANWKGTDVDNNHHTTGALKFSRKIFALNGEQFPSEWLIWIDADVETVKPVTKEFLESVLPEGKLLSYLNREFWRYSECGFVGYRVDDPRARQLLEDIRRCYTSGEFHKLSEWGDSFVFDHCRRWLFGKDGKHPELHRLVEERYFGDINVWPRSPLGKVMAHYKGKRRKLGRFGHHC